MTDTTAPIGAIAEIKGTATITHADGSSEPATLGTPVFQDDVVETAADGALNITFVDDTSFALSEGAKFSIDDYSFDPATESGTSDFSVLHGVFVFTSGLIGRDDPDDVKIETPVGSIGIRGTIIAGKIDADGDSEITVVEGAIVVKNGVSEVTLAQQFESVKLGDFNSDMQPLGVLEAKDIGARYNVISDVTPGLFSNVEDAAQEEGAQDTPAEQPADPKNADAPVEAAPDATQAPADAPTEAQPEATNSTGTTEQTTTRETLVTLETTTPTGFETSTRTTAAVTETTRTTDTTHSDTRSTTAATTATTYATSTTTTSAASDARAYANSTTTMPSRTNATGTSTTTTTTTVDIRHTGVADIHVIGDASNSHFNRIGMEIYGVGDVNGDGFEDFVFKSDWAVGQDHSYVVYGQANRFGSGELIAKVDPNITSVNDVDANGGEIGVLPNIIVTRPLDQVDFNGDGKFDSITSSPGANGGLGQIILNAGAQTVTINNTMTGTVLGGEFGSINDFNGDGKSDIMMSLVGTGNSTVPDTAIILLGKELSSNGTVNTTSLPTNALKISVGPQMSILDGTGIGDFNGDGFDDIALVVQDGDGKGHAFIVYGNATPTDMDWTNLMDSNKAFHINLGQLPLTGYEVNIGAIGDYNGDGFKDFAIGMPDADNDHGLVAIVNGRATTTGVIVGQNVMATANAQSLVGAATNDILSDNNRVGISMGGGAGQDEIRITGTGFHNIDGGSGNNDSINLFGSANLFDFSAINFEQISGIESLAFMNNSQIVNLTVENIFNMLHSSDNGDLWINLNGASGSLKIDSITTPGTSPSAIINALSQTGEMVTHTNSNGYDAYQIGANHTLYIDADLATQVV